MWAPIQFVDRCGDVRLLTFDNSGDIIIDVVGLEEDLKKNKIRQILLIIVESTKWFVQLELFVQLTILNKQYAR